MRRHRRSRFRRLLERTGLRLVPAGFFAGLFGAVMTVLLAWSFLPNQNNQTDDTISTTAAIDSTHSTPSLDLASRSGEPSRPASLSFNTGTLRSNWPTSNQVHNSAKAELAVPSGEQVIKRQTTPFARESSQTDETIYEEPNPPPVNLLDLPAPAKKTIAPGIVTPFADKSLVAVIIDDIGPNRAASYEAINLPTRMTMAFLPYPVGIARMVNAAVDRGHEIMLHLPMEPIGPDNPGPNALLSHLNAEEFERRLDWAIDRVPHFTGVNNHMGSRLTANFDAMSRVMSAVRSENAFFVDSRTSSLSVADKAAAIAGVDHTVRDVFLDNQPDVGAIMEQLKLVEEIAHRRGSAVAIGHPYPETISALRQWLPTLQSENIAIVSVSDLIKFRDCVEGANARRNNPACVDLVALR